VDHQEGWWIRGTSQDNFGKYKLGEPHPQGLVRAIRVEIAQSRTSTRKRLSQLQAHIDWVHRTTGIWQGLGDGC